MWEIIIELVLWFMPFSLRDRLNKGKEWTGVVEEVKLKGDFSPARRSTIIVFRREDGSTTRVKLKESHAAPFSVGQRYRKHKGETLPRPV